MKEYFSFRAIRWRHHNQGAVLKKMNEMGRDGWRIVGNVDEVILLEKRTEDIKENLRLYAELLSDES